MPGQHVTNQQVRNFMSNVKTQGVRLASMKAGFSRSTGFHILSRGGTMPCKMPRNTSRGFVCFNTYSIDFNEAGAKCPGIQLLT